MTGINKQKKILAVSSSGGHWVQLMRLRPAWDDCTTSYLTTEVTYKADVLSYASERGLQQPAFYTTVLASRWSKLKLLRQLFEVMYIVLRVRPDIIISTGASLGFFAFKIGQLIGAKTIWVDSIANVEQISLTGEKVKNCSDVWLTQWPHLAETDPKNTTKEKKPEFWGASL